MAFCKRIYTLTALLTLSVLVVSAQDKPIGYWESHLPYNNALGVATDGTTLYTICNQAFFTFNPKTASVLPVPYSKVEGMSDIGMQCVGYDLATSTAVLVYINGNVDLFKNNTFYNIPDLKIKNLSGTKTVFNVYTENGFAYLSTSLGVLVIDLSNHLYIQTYQFIDLQNVNNAIIAVKSFTGAGSYFYAATESGLFRILKNNSQIQNFQAWQKIDSNAYTNAANVNNKLFFSTPKSVFTLTNNTLQLVYSSATTITHIDAGINNLFISEYYDTTFTGYVKTLDINNNIINSDTLSAHPLQVVQRLDGSIWIADYFYGLTKIAGPNKGAIYIPVGPPDPLSFDLYASNKNLWIAHGGFNTDFYAMPGFNGISNLSNGKWTSYTSANYPPFYTMRDFVALAKDESKGILYAASYLNGLFILNKDGSYQVVDQNSILEPSIQNANGPDARQIVGLAIDKSSNLWVSQIDTRHQLFAKTPDGKWYKFNVPGITDGGPIAIDDNGLVWFVSYENGGVGVYNTNGTLNDPTDDASYHLTTGAGSGNLPGNNVSCIVKDKNNDIWVGTDNGIGIISGCFPSATQSSICDANWPIVQYDKYAGYLFAGSNVVTLAVDGANRKWVGTDDGVWLLSSNASQIIYRFTIDNSPLPSNHVRKISIDDVTGDVYIGTEMGLVSFHSTATEGGASNQDVQIFPNPVKSGYMGTIAIRGLAANADVRITDIDGQLIYHTTALGGQAVWNGMNYKGQRPQTGVYLIFVSSNDGAQTYSGKIVFTQ